MSVLQQKTQSYDIVELRHANISDSADAQKILEGIRKRWPWMKHLFADGGYDRSEVMWWTALSPGNGVKLGASKKPCVDGPSGARVKSVVTADRMHPCVRPVFAAVAAGLDEFRGSKPKSPQRARRRLVPVGLIDPRPSRFVITSHHPGTSTRRAISRFAG